MSGGEGAPEDGALWFWSTSSSMSSGSKPWYEIAACARGGWCADKDKDEDEDTPAPFSGK